MLQEFTLRYELDDVKRVNEIVKSRAKFIIDNISTPEDIGSWRWKWDGGTGVVFYNNSKWDMDKRLSMHIKRKSKETDEGEIFGMDDNMEVSSKNKYSSFYSFYPNLR